MLDFELIVQDDEVSGEARFDFPEISEAQRAGLVPGSGRDEITQGFVRDFLNELEAAGIPQSRASESSIALETGNAVFDFNVKPPQGCVSIGLP